MLRCQKQEGGSNFVYQSTAGHGATVIFVRFHRGKEVVTYFKRKLSGMKSGHLVSVVASESRICLLFTSTDKESLLLVLILANGTPVDMHSTVNNF